MLREAKPYFTFDIWMIVAIIILLILVTVAISYILVFIRDRGMLNSNIMEETKIILPKNIVNKVEEIVNEAKKELSEFEINNSEQITFSQLRKRWEKELKDYTLSDEYKFFTMNPSSDKNFITKVDELLEKKADKW